jgi:hypothetical protein
MQLPQFGSIFRVQSSGTPGKDAAISRKLEAIEGFHKHAITAFALFPPLGFEVPDAQDDQVKALLEAENYKLGMLLEYQGEKHYCYVPKLNTQA